MSDQLRETAAAAARANERVDDLSAWVERLAGEVAILRAATAVIVATVPDEGDELARWRKVEAADYGRCARRLRWAADVANTVGELPRSRMLWHLADQFEETAGRVASGEADHLRDEEDGGR